jgi:hypothetical protein
MNEWLKERKNTDDWDSYLKENFLAGTTIDFY